MNDDQFKELMDVAWAILICAIVTAACNLITLLFK